LCKKKRRTLHGATSSPTSSSVWKYWGHSQRKILCMTCHPKYIGFKSSNRLEKRGWWPNCGVCPLCKQALESVEHHFVSCRFTLRLWGLIKIRLGLCSLDLATWPAHSIFSWWTVITKRKKVASITLLASWKIWDERHTRDFRNKHAPASLLLVKIKN
jgi:hypothetical protein